jgi:hypothetical protein
MTLAEEHVAHPRLYGAPAYARPQSAGAPTELPLDPDDLPLAVAQTPEEQLLAESLPTGPYQSVSLVKPSPAEPQAPTRPVPLFAFASRILRRAS